MAIIIGVRFREVGRVYYFDPGDYQVKKGQRVIVETARGVECGEVVQENTDVPEEQVKRPLKLMIRAATEDDLQALEGKAEKEAEAFKICEEKILKHGLDMKLVNVEYTFDASKIIFHFTADQRVDFRALVRDLAGVFRTRIELRQIGVRDEAKLLGGLGVCGRPFCCSLFMGDFHPVSIKMAKEQGLSLNPTKISGTCGRLMCCLKYEEAAYEDALKDLPAVGSFIDTPEGRGAVTEVNAISKMVKVSLDRRPDAAPQSFLYGPQGAQRKNPHPLEEAAPAEAQEVKQPESRKAEHRQDRHERRPAPPPKRPESGEANRGAAGGERLSGGGTGKSWRERHPAHKQDAPPPAYRQEPPRRAVPPPPPRKTPAPGEKPVPRYSEIPAPQRANAPQPKPQGQPGGANYRRQPWQKGKGNKGQGE